MIESTYRRNSLLYRMGSQRSLFKEQPVGAVVVLLVIGGRDRKLQNMKHKIYYFLAFTQFLDQLKLSRRVESKGFLITDEE